MTASRRVALTLVGCLLMIVGCAERQNQTSITVSAASDLRAAFAAVGPEFTKETGITVNVTYGSSGQLAQQISEGAPVDVFASADRSLTDSLAEAGDAVAASSYVYGLIRLSIATANGVPTAATIDSLSDNSYARVAIANPDHAPYGRAAKQAIDRSSTGVNISNKLVIAENVSDALRLVETGNVDAAVVARSLVIAPSKPLQSSVVDVPETSHDRIEQSMIVTADSEEGERAAQQFIDFVASTEGQKLMAQFGFAPS